MVWYMVCGMWYVVCGMVYGMVYGMAYGMEYGMVYGICYMVHGTGYMVQGTWCMVHGTLCMVSGVYGVYGVYGVWCMVYVMVYGMVWREREREIPALQKAFGRERPSSACPPRCRRAAASFRGRPSTRVNRPRPLKVPPLRPSGLLDGIWDVLKGSGVDVHVHLEMYVGTCCTYSVTRVYACVCVCGLLAVGPCWLSERFREADLHRCHEANPAPRVLYTYANMYLHDTHTLVHMFE